MCRSTLQDFEKFAEREKIAKASPLTQQAEQVQEEGGGAASEQTVNREAEFDEALSLKDGEKIKINFKMKSSSSRTSHRGGGGEGAPPLQGGGSFVGVLMPPPGANKEVDQVNTPLPDPVDPPADDDWGDFVSST
jgi:hypothetical protein